ncbi:hypothetical protein VTN96DRAFT_4790 [Rasamsonia emersonii]
MTYRAAFRLAACMGDSLLPAAEVVNTCSGPPIGRPLCPARSDWLGMPSRASSGQKGEFARVPAGRACAGAWIMDQAPCQLWNGPSASRMHRIWDGEDIPRSYAVQVHNESQRTVSPMDVIAVICTLMPAVRFRNIHSAIWLPKRYVGCPTAGSQNRSQPLASLSIGNNHSAAALCAPFRLRDTSLSVA